MRIATWNVNSVNARLPTVLAWIMEANPQLGGYLMNYIVVSPVARDQ